jgi:hypothetical protein
MATPTLVTVRDFSNSRYAQLAESADNLNISDILANAETIIQEKLGRNIGITAYTEVIRHAEVNTFFLPMRPMTSVTSVRKRLATPFGAWTTVDPTYYGFETGPGYVEILYDDVRGYDIEITYQAGYSDIPGGLREAILLQAVLLSAQDFEAYGTGDSRAPGYVQYMSKQIDDFLYPYRATATVYR